MRILMAGLGSAGQRHVRNLRAMFGGDVELHAYRVRGLARVLGADGTVLPGSVDEAYGITMFASLPEALAARPDAVFVTNPTDQHLRVALAAAHAGCHLFIEKPVSHTLEGLTALRAAVARAGTVCAVGYQLRLHPVFLALRDLLAARAVGRVLSARLDFGEYLPAWHPWEDYRQMFQAQRARGGGVVLEQSHDLDYALALFGPARQVAATGGRSGEIEIDAEDWADMLLTCGDADAPVPVHVHQDMLRQPQTRTCSIIGTTGRIEADFVASQVTVIRPSGAVEAPHVVPVERNALFVDELRHFFRAVAGRGRPLVTLDQAAATLRVAVAALEAIGTGEPVAVG
ncbi:MAG: Gfo/Idh/MocA family protein [Alphaproteobacteria bacterium]